VEVVDVKPTAPVVVPWDRVEDVDEAAVPSDGDSTPEAIMLGLTEEILDGIASCLAPM
jgi:hypothetical protein